MSCADHPTKGQAVFAVDLGGAVCSACIAGASAEPWPDLGAGVVSEVALPLTSPGLTPLSVARLLGVRMKDVVEIDTVAGTALVRGPE